MNQSSDRYGRALKRLLNEVQLAIYERDAYNEICRISPHTSWGFFSYASIALKNDMVSHAIKVLDDHKDACAFWYIYRCKKGSADKELKKVGLDIPKIQELADKLKNVRDKTHFHIDKSKVFAPEKVWSDADIRGEKFNQVMDGLLILFHSLYQEHFGEPLVLRAYDAKDIEPIINAVKAKKLKI